MCRNDEKISIRQMVLGDMQVNSFLVSGVNSCFVVDPGDSFETLKGEIEKCGLPLKYILLTHGHFDHIGAVEKLKKAYPYASVVIGEDDNEKLTDPQKNLSIKFNMYDKDKVISFENADVCVVDGDSLDFDNMKIDVVACPGHSKGGVAYVLNDIIFAGDTLFKMTAGRTDFADGDENAILSSIRRLYSLPEKYGYDNMYVLCGHGENTDIAFEKRHNIFVRES